MFEKYALPIWYARACYSISYTNNMAVSVVFIGAIDIIQCQIKCK
jgi:hypothetical protein